MAGQLKKFQTVNFTGWKGLKYRQALGKSSKIGEALQRLV